MTKDKIHRPDAYSLDVLRSKSPPLWNQNEFPLSEYESHRELVAYEQYLDCPSGDGGHLEFQERSGTMKNADGVQLCCIHKCTSCSKYWGIQDQKYPRQRYYFRDLVDRVRIRQAD